VKLLCTDLDRTLLPNGEQPESPAARAVLWHLLKTHDCELAYVSGRDLNGVLEAINEYDLATPAYIAADVGSTIYEQENGEWVANTRWTDSIRSDWKGGDTHSIKNLLDDLPELENQEAKRQSQFKRSYYYDESLDEQELAKPIEEQLVSHDIEASLVFSHDPEKSVGLLDVLPRSATKREAVEFLTKLMNLRAEDVLFSGDSGNDVDAITAENPSVLVANADEATLAAVQEGVRLAGVEASTCFAKGGVEINGQALVHASLPASLNGNYSAGIVEGLLYFRPSWRGDLLNASWVREALDAYTSEGTSIRKKSA